MNTPGTMQLVFGLLGGLALFIYGMRTMSQGLSAAVGEGIRGIIAKATRNRLAGIALGSSIGFLIQSSASIVLFIGFINAGLMTFGQSLAPMLGANIGTTLSVQLISFKLSDYCLVGVFIGLMMNLIATRPKFKFGGLALLGFGLLFLGMTIMGDAIRPHRELFEYWMSHIHGSTTAGLISGTLIAALATGIIQSSGAVIGMGFALISAGAITDFQGIYPIIIGANIGTCVTGLLASIGTTIAARRIAIAHLLFNIISTALAIAAAPLFYTYIPLTSGDLIHQAANANTIKMLLSALLFLPLVPVFGKIVVFITPTKTKQPESSFLDHALLDRPEQAIFACLRELQRTCRICAHSLHLAAEEFIQHTPARAQRIHVNEQSVNTIKSAMRDYLAKLTRHYLSKRQAILIEHIDRCMSDLERVGDHIANLGKIAERQRAIPAARFIPAAIEDWLSIYRAVDQLLAKVIESLDPEAANFQELAKEILTLREAFRTTALAAQHAHFKRLEEKVVTPIAGMLFNDYLSNFWRITKHIKSIALAEQQPQFWIKRTKLDKVMSNDAPGYTVPEKPHPNDYLDKLQSDDFR
ncbi:MAG: Na/Pi cotransporter family protein [Kiritimatiellales bacterium]|nr:Na/Pi cotransporter family protein [Kiritimatiellales bacterium]